MIKIQTRFAGLAHYNYGYSTIENTPKTNKICEVTFRIIESLRVVSFETADGNTVMIPFENIVSIIQSPKTKGKK